MTPINLFKIVNKRKLLEKIYDSLYDEASKVLSEFNPCEHKVCNSCHTCLGKTDFTARKGSYGDNTSEQACCIGCKYWNKGCTATKPLYCKVWLCGTAGKKHPLVLKKLSIIEGKARGFFILQSREDKNTSISFALKWMNLEWNKGFYTFKSLKSTAEKRGINLT
jgi:hypothetical protein